MTLEIIQHLVNCGADVTPKLIACLDQTQMAIAECLLDNGLDYTQIEKEWDFYLLKPILH